MDYPFYYKGKRSGTFSLTESGIFSLLRVEGENIYEKMLRLSVYGEGKEYYLGIAEIKNANVYIEKKLSRSEMKNLPGIIEYAAESGKKIPENTEKKTEKWKRRKDGSLWGNDGISDIVALPAELRSERGKEKIKFIDGRTYMLFRY